MSDYPNLQAMADGKGNDVAREREEAKAALAVIARMPKTADGVPVIVHEHPVVFVFTKRKGLYRPGEKAAWWEMIVDEFDGERFCGMVAGSHRAAFRSEDCYSTYEAAVMAAAAITRLAVMAAAAITRLAEVVAESVAKTKGE